MGDIRDEEGCWNQLEKYSFSAVDTNKVIQELKLLKNAKILDVGTGMGRLAITTHYNHQNSIEHNRVPTLYDHYNGDNCRASSMDIYVLF